MCVYMKIRAYGSCLSKSLTPITDLAGIEFEMISKPSSPSSSDLII